MQVRTAFWRLSKTDLQSYVASHPQEKAASKRARSVLIDRNILHQAHSDAAGWFCTCGLLTDRKLRVLG
jgi:hypothetical protein